MTSELFWAFTSLSTNTFRLNEKKKKNNAKTWKKKKSAEGKRVQAADREKKNQMVCLNGKVGNRVQELRYSWSGFYLLPRAKKSRIMQTGNSHQGKRKKGETMSKYGKIVKK